MHPYDLPTAPPGTFTVRVGCALSYRAEECAPLLLKIQPRPVARQILLEEVLTTSTGAPIDRSLDADGNLVLQLMLQPGMNDIRHDAFLCVPDEPDNSDNGLTFIDASAADLAPYLLPSRYCESDKLVAFAQSRFGAAGTTLATVQSICTWTHRHIEYRYGSGDSTLSAVEAIARGYGVCRDFAHVMIALCRALDIPARYVAGHIPLRSARLPGSDIGIDFHAYVEVLVDGAWRTFDPRHNDIFAGRVKIAHGADAVDNAFATFYGRVAPVNFRVWSYAIDFSNARVDDPVCLPA